MHWATMYIPLSMYTALYEPLKERVLSCLQRAIGMYSGMCRCSVYIWHFHMWGRLVLHFSLCLRVCVTSAQGYFSFAYVGMHSLCSVFVCFLLKSQKGGEKNPSVRLKCAVAMSLFASADCLWFACEENGKRHSGV